MTSPAALLSSWSGVLAPVCRVSRGRRVFLPVVVAGSLPGGFAAAALGILNERRRDLSQALPAVVARVVRSFHCPSVRSFVSRFRAISYSAKQRLAQEPFRDLQTAFEKNANV